LSVEHPSQRALNFEPVCHIEEPARRNAQSA
jgi:hypothetical protein